MDQNEVLRLCTVLVGLNKDPQPGIAQWHIACERIANELRAALGPDPKASTTGDGRPAPIPEAVPLHRYAIRYYGDSQKMGTYEIDAPTAEDAITFFKVNRMAREIHRSSSGPYVGDIESIRCAT